MLAQMRTPFNSRQLGTVRSGSDLIPVESGSRLRPIVASVGPLLEWERELVRSLPIPYCTEWIAYLNSFLKE
jgi:hypothetical protein